MVAGSSKTNKKIRKESFMQGVLALMVSQVLIKALGLVYKLYLTNKEGFGDEGNAIYSAGYQIYALLLSISSIGVPNAVSKLIAERLSLGDSRGAHRIFKIAFATFGLIGIIGTSILLMGARPIANMMGMPEAEMTLVALSPSIFFVSVMSVIRGFFNGRSKIKVTANSQTLEQVFKTVFTILVVEIIAVLSGANTTLMAAGANLATTLAVVGSFIYLLAYYKVHKRDKLEVEEADRQNYASRKKSSVMKKSVLQIVKSILWVSIPISLSSILVSVNKNIDSFTVVNLLKRFLSAEEAREQYGILSGKIEVLTSLPLSFNVAFATALVPAITAARTKGELGKGVKRISFSLLTTIVIVLPCVVGMVIFADPILKLLTPNAPKGAWIMQVCVLATIFTAMEQTINGALQGLGKVMVPAMALGTGCIVKLILNLILLRIPDLNVYGAAIGSIACHAVAFTIVFNVLKKHVQLKLPFKKFVFKPLIATTIMGICSYTLFTILNGIKIGNKATIISIIFAIIIYLISVIALKIYDKEDILMLPKGTKIYNLLEKMKIY